MAGSLSQEGRLLQVDTPLGADKLMVTSFSGGEQISGLFRFVVDFLSEDGNIQAPSIVGKNVTLKILHADGSTQRPINGFVSRFVQLPSEGRHHRYQAVVVPWLWFLTLITDCRIFQDQSVPEILEAVFRDCGFSDFETSGIQGRHDKWEYCVWYRETAFQFLSRLMEQEGIFYFFRHQEGKHFLVLADQKSIHKPCPFQSKLRMEPASGPGPLSEEDSVSDWDRSCQFRTGKWSQTDYNFEMPSTSLMSNAQTVIPLAGVGKFEFYDYPGEFDSKTAGTDLTRLRMEEEELPHDLVQGEGGCRSFCPGFKFTLEHHERKDQNASYLLTSVQHQAQQGAFATDDQSREAFYSNSFSCIPDSVPYRPARSTAKPFVEGTQTAVVTGPQGEEIYCDKYGRVKVQFHWDRLGKRDQNSSCWMRVAQPWAGKKWAGMWLPRIGQEVVVDFEEGDPDRPLIVGRVYNAEQMPAVQMPDHQTRSTFKSRSSKKGGTSNFNEIRFEDKKGSEQVFINAEKDQDQRVENDSREFVGNDRHLTVKKDQLELLEAEKHLHIQGNHQETIDGKMSFKVLGDIQVKVGGLEAGEASKQIHLKAGSKLVFEAGMQLTFKVGSNFVGIDPTGVTVKGSMVKINAGGSATSGSGSSPKLPSDPAEAATSIGGSGAVRSGGMEPQPVTFGDSTPLQPLPPAAAALVAASKSGTPFIECAPG